MALRTIGYEGEGRTRRAIRIDEGPARARVPNQIGEGKTALPDRELTGAGQIERRFITEVEREVRAAAVVKPSPIAPRPHLVAVTPSPAEEEHVEAVPPTAEPIRIGSTTLEALHAAVADAVRARDNLHQAEQLHDEAKIQWLGARDALDAAYHALEAIDAPAVSEPVPSVPLVPEPTPIRPTAEGGRSTTEQLQQSRRNGQAAMQAQRRAVELTSAAAAKAEKPKGTTGQKRTPEQRERMRVAMLASIARRKAAEA